MDMCGVQKTVAIHNDDNGKRRKVRLHNYALLVSTQCSMATHIVLISFNLIDSSIVV